jgi:hypothetical protein
MELLRRIEAEGPMAAKKGTKRAGKTASGLEPQEVLVMILGSGPSVAAFQALVAANAANGVMYAHAVQQQQMTNLLGMAVTAKCVRYMLEGPGHDASGEASAKRSTKRTKR